MLLREETAIFFTIILSVHNRSAGGRGVFTIQSEPFSTKNKTRK